MKPFLISTKSPLSANPSNFGRFVFQRMVRCVAGIVLGAAVLSAVPAWSATIYLATPVSDSIETITGIYWTANATYNDGSMTADSSGNGYHGTLTAGGGEVPSLVTGVNLSGTSDYLDGLRLETNATAPGGSGNPRITAFLPSANNLIMANTSFTGGAWLSFSSLLAGTQQVMIMDRGTRGLAASTNGGGWSFLLEKNADDEWRFAFTARDNASSTTIYSGAFSDLGIDLNEWYHFGFSFQYVEDDDNLVTFWLDGSAVASNIALDRNITAGTTTDARRFAVGDRSQSTFTSVFDGRVDDIFVTTGLHNFAPVPEPGSLSLLLLGGAFVVLGRRSRSCQTGKRTQHP